jgi:hypothetical protein
VREALHVVGQVARELDDRLAQPRRVLDPAALEPGFDERGKAIGGNPRQPHHRAGLVERPVAPEHPLHQCRLGSCENITDAALDLDGCTERMLDAAAIEGIDRLELVERDRELPSAGLRDAAGKREHFLRKARHFALGSCRRKRDREPGFPGCRGFDPHFRPDRRERLAEPRHRPSGRASFYSPQWTPRSEAPLLTGSGRTTL